MTEDKWVLNYVRESGKRVEKSYRQIQILNKEISLEPAVFVKDWRGRLAFHKCFVTIFPGDPRD